MAMQRRQVPLDVDDEENLGREIEDANVMDESGDIGENDKSGSEDEGEDQDGSEWGGIADKSTTTETHSGTKPKKPPTGEALRVIKDATELFRSSSFKLQIDALLPNVRPKPSRIPPLERFLLTLHSVLAELPSVSPQHPLAGARALLETGSGVAVPYAHPLPTEDAQWTVAFVPPSAVLLVGSWAHSASVKRRDGDGEPFVVDLAVEMPDSLFQEKDYLNGRFFHKRAFYLATLASTLTHADLGVEIDVQYESTAGDPRRTHLVLRPRKDGSASDFSKLHAQVRLIPCLSSTAPIALRHLSPSHANLRVTPSSDSSNGEPLTHAPTPMYNTALLLAFSPKADLLATHALKQAAPAFGDALALLRVWANQRGFGEGMRPCVSGFEGRGTWWSAVLALLITGEERAGGKRRPLGKGLSSYQLFRASLDFLAKHDFQNEPVYVKTANGHQFEPELYVQHHTAVFVNSSSTINILAGVPLTSLDMLKYDAQRTLEHLDSVSVSDDPFTEVFLKEQRDLPARFDAVIRVDLSTAKLRSPSIHSTLEHGSATNALIASLADILRRSLGNRTKAIGLLHPTSQLRSISQAHPSNPTVLHIGLIYDPEHAFRLVDHGPAADDPDKASAERFRDFWGEKAELRRFKDGRIVESVVWDVATPDERAQVPCMVVRHVLARHFGIADSAVHTWQTPFDSILRLPDSAAQLLKLSGVPAGFKSAMAAFDELLKVAKAQDDELPLAILNISPASEYLRYTSVFSPVPLPPASAVLLPECMRYLPPMEVVLEFEKSARWPDDLRAIQKVKLAFFERLANVVMASMKGTRAIVVLGDGLSVSEIEDQARLEIITAQGWVFSMRIWHDREATLLDRIIDQKPRPNEKLEESKGKERQEALQARELYTRRFIHSPRHHRAIASLCHKFTAYAGTARLVKRWLASHWLLHGQVSEEVAEVICAKFFVGDGKNPGEGTGVPGSKERGFATVVDFLRTWKWEEGLFVPLYASDGSSTTQPPEVVVTAGSANGVWTVSTELDVGGHMWTSDGPDAMSAHRVRALAQATWEYLQGMEDGVLDVKALFTHPTEDYDFVIDLEPSILPRYIQNVNTNPAVWAKKGKYSNLDRQEGDSSRPLRPGFDPAMLLFDDLRGIYADTLKFFYDPFGGDRIGAVWDPSLKTPRPFRVLGGFSSMPARKETDKGKDKGLVALNEKAILTEIERLGAGIIIGNL